MWWYVLFVGFVVAQDVEIVVIRLTVPYEQQQNLVLNNSVEYIIDFVPNAEQQLWPGRLSLAVDGGDETHPVLLTARQGAGAVSWQLPYTTSGILYRSMERYLCQNSNGYNGQSDCAGPETQATNAFSLHISTTCYSVVNLTVAATPGRDWYLTFQSSVSLTVTPTAPKVHYYKFETGQDSVRLALSSEDDVCALISVQNVTCPILQTEEALIATGLRMTMLRSAAVQIQSRFYPHGFFLVVTVKGNDVECSGLQEEAEDWLFQAAFGILEKNENTNNRIKTLSVIINPTLTRAQYAIAASVTFLIFLTFYALFLALVFAQRWPWFAKHVRPLAPISEPLASQQYSGALTASSPTRRQRRISTATFDSDDNSDSEDEGDQIITPPVSFSDHGNTTTPNVSFANTANETIADDNVEISRNINTNQQGVESTQLVDGNGTGIFVIGPENMQGSVVENNNNNITNNGTNLNSNGETSAVASPASSTPYGLPATLRLAALSRRGARVLRARSDRYLQTLFVVAVFYALPVMQFVIAFQIVLNVSGSLDICYYNFLCSHPAGALSDFNHVFSNLGYLMLGALFMLQVRRRRQRRKRAPRNEEYGIPAHYGLLSSLGAAMMVVAVLSASYHVCPNQLNFQFDTAFMYVLAVLSMVKIYQSRHPDVNARAHATFGVLAVLIALVVWGVLGGSSLFWGIFTVVHLFTFMILSLRIYYVGQFRLERAALQTAARELTQVPKFGVRPLYKPRLVMLLIANSVNWMFALYGVWQQGGDFAGHLLQVLLGNALLYMVFYLVMKLVHGERPRWYAWCYLAGATLAWVPALYFFLSGSSDWSATPAMSRHKNHECYVMHFYDSHDLWHLLSAVALYLSFNAMMTWDDGLAAVKRTEIVVF